MKSYRLFLLVLLSLTSYMTMAQCPAPPTTCNFTVTSGSNQTSNFSIGANQALCVNSGTFTGNITSVASSGIIYVAPGATFNPAAFSNFGGRFINCGTATMPGFNFDNTAGLARIENYGVATFTGSYGFNQKSVWINGLNSKMTFNGNMVMNSVTFTNNGNVLMKGSFTMNTGTNIFINHDSLTALGNINLNATINNDGYLFAKGANMVLNASGNIQNSCYFIADGGFTYNGIDTLFVTGFTWVTGLNGSSFIIQGKAVEVTGEGFIQGINFSNNGTPVVGSGKFVFSGTTINQGPFGNDANGLNFYDSSVPPGSNVFDSQNTLPHGSVTKNITAKRDGTFIPNTCSNLIKCNIASAGNDTVVCGSTIDMRDARPSDPYYEAWKVEPGNPVATTIDAVTGIVTGMSVAGTYQYRLYKITNPNCYDLVKVTVNTLPVGTMTVAGGTYCRTAAVAPVTINNTEAGVTYDAYLGSAVLVSGAGNGNTLTLNVPVSGLLDGTNTITFKANKTACATVTLNNSALVTISPQQDPNVSVTATSPICSGNTSTVTIAATKGITYTIRDQNGNVLGSATAGSTGSLSITTSALTATSGPTSYTFTITASVASCVDVILVNKPVVVVNPVQNPNASVTAASPLCSGNTSNVIIAATNGITYTIRDQNNNLLGSSTATSNGNLTITTSTLTAIGAQASYTLTITASVAGCNNVALSTHPVIVVNPLLVPSVALSATASTICAGTSVTVTATPTNGGSSPLYQWKLNGANAGAITSNNTYTSTSLVNGDVVSVVLTSNATCATPTTANSTSNINMTVNPLLTPSVTLASSATTICAGTSVTVTATPKNGGAAPTYQWKVNGANSGNVTSSNTYTSSTLANGDVISVVLTSNATCATPTTASSTSNVTMTVNPNVTPTVTISAPATTICSGSSITFTASPTHGGASPTYQWKINGADVSGATGATFTTTTLVNGDKVSVVLTSNAICRTSNTAISNVITMNIGTNLVPSVNISTPATTVCAGNLVVFTATVANAGTAPMYQWKINGVNAGAVTSQNTFSRSNLVNGDQVSVVLTSNETCVVTNTANSNVITMVVNPVQPASASVTVVSPICSGSTSKVTIAATKGMTYTVRDQNNNIIGSGLASSTGNLDIQTSVLTATAGPTTYTLTVTATIAGCDDVVLNTKPTILVNPAQNPNATVTATSPICSGGTSSIISVFGTNGITYTVEDQDNKILGSGTASANGTLNITTSSLIAANEPTTYTFTIIATVAGCNAVPLTVKPQVLVNPAQNPNAGVTATSPICSGGSSVVSIVATKGIKYTVKDQNNNVLGSATASASATLAIPTSVLTATTEPTLYTFSVTASVDGCNDLVLNQKPVITVNPAQNPNAGVSATSPICSGGSSIVSILATKGITYSVKDQNSIVLGTATATSNGLLAIPTLALSATDGPANYVFTVTGTVAGCNDVNLVSKPTVTVNPVQNPNVSVTATSPICSGSFSVVSIAATKGISYTVKDQNNNILGNATATATGNLDVKTSTLTATGNPTSYTFTVTASVSGCNDVVLANKPKVNVNKTPAQVSAIGSTICSTTANATVTLAGVETNVSYQAYKGNVSIGDPIVGPSKVITIPNVAPIALGANEISIRATVEGCNTVNITDTAKIVVNLLPTSRVFTATSPICEGTFTTVNLTNPQPGVVYSVFDKLDGLVSALSPALNVSGIGNYALTGVGSHAISIKADILGCATVEFPDTAAVQVNTGVKPVIVAGIPNGPICENNNAITITIENPENSVDYHVYALEGTSEKLLNISPITEASPQFTLDNIPVGLSDYIIKATIGGCGTATVYSFSVTVDKNIDKNTPQLDAGAPDVCEGTGNVRISLKNTQLGVEYTLFDNGKKFANSKVSNLQGSTLDFGTFTFAVGPHKISVKGKNVGCDSVLLTTTDSVNVNKKIDSSAPKLSADTNVVCSDGTAVLHLLNTQSGVTYTIYQDGVSKEFKRAKSDGEKLDFGPYSLSVGNHVFTLDAFNNACSDTILSSQSIKVNEKPNAKAFKVSLNKPVLCSNADLMVYVENSRNVDYEYQVLDQFGSEVKMLGDKKKGNGGLLTFGPFTGLATGDHLIKVVESVQNCSSDTSIGTTLTINNSLDVDKPVISSNAHIICEDGSVNVSILMTSKGDIYKLYLDKDSLMGAQTAAFEGDTLVYGPFFGLKPGRHTFGATTTNAGCGTFLLNDSANIVINPIPDTATLVSNNSPICKGNAAVINVAPLKDVSYTLLHKIDSSFVAGPSTGILTTPVYNAAGKDSLIVRAEIAGCAPVMLSSIQYITINDYPVENLSAEDVTICTDDSAKMVLKGTSTKFDYKASLSGGIFKTKNGPGDLEFGFASDDVKLGVDVVTYTIVVPGCPLRDVLTSNIYRIKDTVTLANDVICEDSLGYYTVKPVMGAKGYQWILPAGMTMVSQNVNSAVVRAGDTSSSGMIKVYPINTKGESCTQNVTNIKVKVYQTIKGTATYFQKDILCVGEIDTVGIENLQGVLKDSLMVDVGIKIIKQIQNNSAYPKYVVQYTKPGKFINKYLVVSPCGSDSIYLADTVNVLGYPIADAGTYPVYEMKYFPREVVLDGSGSSKGGYIYKWEALPSGNISNSQNMIASLVPQQGITEIKLTVLNAQYGICPSYDTTKIMVDLGIFIPNVFTPNADSDHDTWMLENVNSFYPNVSVDIYSKWGTHIYSSQGYSTPWDGTRNGQELPAATYYYVIDLKKPGYKPISGPVTIIR